MTTAPTEFGSLLQRPAKSSSDHEGSGIVQSAGCAAVRSNTLLSSAATPSVKTGFKSLSPSPST
jgi:hypothetical protein